MSYLAVKCRDRLTCKDHGGYISDETLAKMGYAPIDPGGYRGRHRNCTCPKDWDEAIGKKLLRVLVMPNRSDEAPYMPGCPSHGDGSDELGGS